MVLKDSHDSPQFAYIRSVGYKELQEDTVSISNIFLKTKVRR